MLLGFVASISSYAHPPISHAAIGLLIYRSSVYASVQSRHYAVSEPLIAASWKCDLINFAVDVIAECIGFAVRQNDLLQHDRIEVGRVERRAVADHVFENGILGKQTKPCVWLRVVAVGVIVIGDHTH